MFSLSMYTLGDNGLKRTIVQVILFEIDCATFYIDLHELFCQFISWTNWVNSGKSMDNCWISGQVTADMKKLYNDLIIINILGFLSKNCITGISMCFIT